MDARRKRAAALIVCMFLQKHLGHEEKPTVQQKKRKCWVKPWIGRRSEASSGSPLVRELQIEDAQQFRNFVRMSAVEVQVLIDAIAPMVGKKDTRMRKAISVQDRVLLTLRFLASGDSYSRLQHVFRIPVCTIGRIVREVTAAIYGVLQYNFLKFPTTEAEWLTIAEGFEKQWNFPHCVGALDGRHIVTQSPESNGSFFHKGEHSVVLLGVVDATHKFTYIDVRSPCPGGAFQNCSLYDGLECGTVKFPNPTPLSGRPLPVPYFFAAADGSFFPQKSYILQPYSFREQAAPNQVFNYRLSRVCRIAENAFGIIANRFRVLRKTLNLHPERVETIVLAICTIHNFLLSTTAESRENYLFSGSVDFEDPETHCITPGNWRDNAIHGTYFPLQQENSDESAPSQDEVRDEFREYFMTPSGAVAWQFEYI